jgi:hypothetical protein
MNGNTRKRTVRKLCSCFAVLIIASMHLAAETQFTLVKISSDSFHNAASQHKTEVEPDSYSWQSTIVAAYQVARIYEGGGADLGFSTSTDSGNTWIHGDLPGVTVNYKDGAFDAASDASVAYCARYGVWLISSLLIGGEAVDVGVSRSSDALNWEPLVVVDGNGLDDKNWITCDNSTKSPYYGNCYTEWDQAYGNGQVMMSVSADGGQTWSFGQSSADGAVGTGGQPIVQPNGRVVVPFLGDNGIEAFTSDNGGISWNKSITVVQPNVFQDNSGLRSSSVPLPSVGIDKQGEIYIVWVDCRFRHTCTTNDLVMSTSRNGRQWTSPSRIPIDGLSSRVDHFIPGLGVDPSTSGASAHLTAIYYYFPDAACDGNACRLHVGFTTSQDGGTTWTAGKQLAGPMELDWLPNTFSGVMVADYLSMSYTNGNPFGVFMVAKPPENGLFNEAAYTTREPLLVSAHERKFSSKGERQLSRGKNRFEFHDVDLEDKPSLQSDK